MKIVREGRGIFRVEMTDEERREAYRVEPEVVAGIRAALLTGDMRDVQALVARAFKRDAGDLR